MHKIYELKEKLCDELEEYGEKKLDAGTLDVVDKLAHTIKNLDKIIEKYEMDEYSSADGMMAYNDGRRGSYARGRRRDSMGRYSRAERESMITELREIMRDAPEESKGEFRKFIQKLESM